MNRNRRRHLWADRLRPVLASLGALPGMGVIAAPVLTLCELSDRDLTDAQLSKMNGKLDELGQKLATIGPIDLHAAGVTREALEEWQRELYVIAAEVPKLRQGLAALAQSLEHGLETLSLQHGEILEAIAAEGAATRAILAQFAGMEQRAEDLQPGPFLSLPPEIAEYCEELIGVLDQIARNIALGHLDDAETRLSNLMVEIEQKYNLFLASTQLAPPAHIGNISGGSAFCDLLFVASSHIGAVAAERNDYSHAADHYRNALCYARGTGDKRKVVWALTRIGIAYGLGGEPESAERYFYQACVVSPEDPHALYNLALSIQGQAISAQEPSRAAELYEQASQQYEKAVELKDDLPAAWNNWGNTLQDWATAIHTDDPSHARELYRQALGKFARAVEIQENYERAWHNWGNALKKSANRLLADQPAHAVELYEQACEKHEKAVGVKPDFHGGWAGWGHTLGCWADAIWAEQPGIATQLYEQACQKYQKAVTIKDDWPEAWNDWGTALGRWGDVIRIQKPPQAAKLYKLACEKFAKAVGIKWDFAHGWINWGSALVGLYHCEGDRGHLDEAHTKFLRAEQLQAGSATYGLACWAALSGRADDAFERLEEALSKGTIAWGHVATDPDWDSLRSDARYGQLNRKYSTESC